MRKIGHALSIFFALMLFTALFAQTPAYAKTAESANGENIFFYAQNAAGKAVLLKVMPLEDLKKISHGQLSDGLSGTDTGADYSISTTDNYPTTQYCEARGVTVMELVNYIKSVTNVPGAGAVSFSGDDIIRLMATDGFGTYSRSWSYNELYGTDRYYFEGLYDKDAGWNTGWEVAGEDTSKFGMSLDEYNAGYKDIDPYYDNKRAVFDTGSITVPILATESNSGRTTTDALSSSAEPGIAKYIADNGGIVTGCLADALEDTWSLRLALPMTEADLMGARRTAFDNFKWIYNLRLDMTNAPNLVSQGAVAQPQAGVTRSGDKLTVALTCPTPGASIYYSFDGAPQIPYTGPLTIDVSGRDLASDPVNIYMTAVREGWDDAGIITAKYPGLPPAFETLYSGMTGEGLVFHAASGVSSQEWAKWTGALGGIALKTPDINGYPTLDRSKYSIDNTNMTIAFDKSLFTIPGSYSFIFRASTYSNKNVSLSIRDAAPAVIAKGQYPIGGDVTLTFDDAQYQRGLSVYITPPGGDRTMISPSYLDRSIAGQVTIKSGYFSIDSCPVKDTGEYVLTLSNSQYSPDSQDIAVAFVSGFADVAQGSWYYDAVEYVKGAGLFNGTSAATFSPDGGMTRAMFVTVIGRMADAETGGYMQTGFTDADFDTWYGPYIAWASGKGIVNGVGDSMFAPDGPLTREQIAAVLYRYAEFAGADVSARGDLSAFTDAGSISGWALDAMSWANGSKLVNGMGDGTINPGGSATRAQAAQILMNFNKLFLPEVPQ